ncbi:citramalate synthase [Chloroflexota bacterium]
MDNKSNSYPQVEIVEETMREGLQIESAEIPVEDKIRLLDAISETGVRTVVVGSFVSPKWVPQMACIDSLVEGFKPRQGVTYLAFAANQTGYERAFAYVPKLTVERERAETMCHLCDVFDRRNYNRSQADEIAGWPRIIASARERGVEEACIGVGVVFGSNWLGDFSLEQALELLERQSRLWHDAGIKVTRVSFNDAMGWNMPDQVERLVSAIVDRWPEIRTFRLHLHNTRGVAIASVYAALKAAGPKKTLRLDAALGGMGGCPYCGNGRAAGLIPTEDLVYMLEEMGIKTGVDLDRVIEAACLAEEIVGHPLWGHVSKAGPRPRGNRLYPMDLPFIETLEEASHFRKGPGVYADARSPWKEPIRSPARPE